MSGVEDLTEEYVGDFYAMLENDLSSVTAREENKKKADEIFANKKTKRCAAEPTKKIPFGCLKYHPDHKLYVYQGETYCGPHVQSISGMATSMHPVYRSSPKKSPAKKPTATTTTTTTTSSTRPSANPEEQARIDRLTAELNAIAKAPLDSEIAKRRREESAESEARSRKISKLEESVDTRFAVLESKMDKMQVDIAKAVAKAIKETTEAQFNQFIEMVRYREQSNEESDDETPLTTSSNPPPAPPPPPASTSSQPRRFPFFN